MFWYSCGVLLSITAPSINDRGPRFMQGVFAALHQSLKSGEVLQLEYAAYQGEVGIFCRLPDHLSYRVTRLVESKYPNCQMNVIDPAALEPPRVDRGKTLSAELRLEPSLFPMLRFEQFEDLLERKLDDAIEILLGVIRPEEGIQSKIEIAITPATRRQHGLAKGAVKLLDHPFFRARFQLADRYARWITRPWLWMLVWPLRFRATRSDGRFESKTDTTAGRQGDRTDDLQAASDKIGGHLYHARIRLVVFAPHASLTAARDKLQTMYAAFGAFTISRLALFKLRSIRRGRLGSLRPTPGHSFFLSHVELATLFHPATAGVDAERMARSPFTELQAPVNLASGEGEGGVMLGQVKYRSDERAFAIEKIDRRRHLYIVGRTGVGKTSLLENLIRSDVAAGHGVCLIDPHGDLAETIIAAIPSRRTNDVIVFDPADDVYAVAFNPLACRTGWEDRTASGVVSAFKKLYDSWGPRLEDTLRNTVYLAVEHGGTLLSLLRILSDDAYRQRLLATTTDDIALRFWTLEFARWNDRYRTEAVAAILNKVRPFLMNKHVRSVVSQQGRALDLRHVMDDGKILVANLSKGRLGEDNANLLGALLVTSIQQAAMSRADVREEQRPDFYLYIDEFQNYTTGAFADILSEARKYRLNMTVAHQYLGQLDDGTREAVFGNVGSIIAFQVGSDDAEVLVRQLRKYANQLTPEDLTNLPKYHAYIRLLQDGMPQHPFSMKTVQPQAIVEDRTESVRKVSNARYARPKGKVLADLAGTLTPHRFRPQIGTFAAALCF